MKKIVKKYGSSLVIVLSTEDSKIYGFEEGDILELEDIVVIKEKKK